MHTRSCIKLYLFSFFCLLFFHSLAHSEWISRPDPQFSPQSNQESNQPLNENYFRLKKVLDYYESIQSHPWEPLSFYDFKKGASNPDVPQLRERLRLLGDLSAAEDNQSELFDHALEQAVKRFQARHGLKADGLLGRKTEEELNVPPFERAEEIRRNMQRWANLPAHLGNRFIFINIPEFRFDLVEKGQSVLTMKIIVGKPDRPTPELTSQLNQIELNPYWNIPPNIAQKDILPKLLKDPRYLDEMNIKVVQRRKSEVIVLDASRIDWNEAARNGFNYDLRQEPGKNNALGLVRFDFPNEYNVYMHDTPAKDLFNKENRIFSSGCIRLEKPFALLSYLLNGNPEWDVSHLAEALQSGKETTIKVKPIPIYIIYATAWVDRHGVLNFRHDPYGYNEDPNPDEFGQASIDDPFAIPLSFYALN